jgi:hypothetical protein
LRQSSSFFIESLTEFVVHGGKETKEAKEERPIVVGVVQVRDCAAQGDLQRNIIAGDALRSFRHDRYRRKLVTRRLSASIFKQGLCQKVPTRIEFIHVKAC